MEPMDAESADLIESLPFAERANATVFLSMTPQRQRLHTFREQQLMNQKLDAVLVELAEMRKPPYVKLAAGALAFGGAVAAYLFPEHIPR